MDRNENIIGIVTVSMDVIAAEIRLVNHPHGGMMSGIAKTGKSEKTEKPARPLTPSNTSHNPYRHPEYLIS